MGPLRHTLLASLITGATLGRMEHDALTGADGLDALAQTFSSERGLLAAGMEARVAHLEGAAPALSPAVQLAGDTLDVLAPLADRVGLPLHRARLQDASFQHRDPAAHAALVSELGTVDGPDAGTLTLALAATRALLDDHGLAAETQGRVKSRYGLHRKAARKGASPGDLLDRVGVRVLVDDEADCYAVLGAAHARWQAVPGSTDDYIRAPKASGYRSLHTAVRVAPGHPPVELQIRTHAMHEDAETGPAAHWRYKLAQA
jgi:(p)ppGpp synthase/HD superfamily hydrolase